MEQNQELGDICLCKVRLGTCINYPKTLQCNLSVCFWIFRFRIYIDCEHQIQSLVNLTFQYSYFNSCWNSFMCNFLLSLYSVSAVGIIFKYILFYFQSLCSHVKSCKILVAGRNTSAAQSAWFSHNVAHFKAFDLFTVHLYIYLQCCNI